MRRSIFTFLFLVFIAGFCSSSLLSQVSEMKWELDYEIYMRMSNDSNFTYDVKDVFHVTDSKNEFSSEFVFYPVNPGQQYADELSEKKVDTTSYATLWSALHAKIGGGWVHFANCLAYAIEIGNLNLREPIMKRPESNWKPNPITESYKRTKDWEYYIPLSQKNAQKEYKVRVSKDELGDLPNLPSDYISLMNETKQKEYDFYAMSQKKNQVARIDLVKLIMGANYLGEAQISYISNAVQSAIKGYSASKLPSVIVFDDLDAAAAMSLSTNGYSVESIVFKASANLSESEAEERTQKINKIIANINDYNQKAFQRRLGSYYSK